MRGMCLVAAVLLLSAWAAGASCEETNNVALAPLPEGDNGIAAKYPGDAGIEKDPAVILYEGFEDCSKPADLRKKWDGVLHDGNMRIVEEAANVNGGKKAVEFTVPKQETDLAVSLNKVLKEERDVLFLRWYSKFEKGFETPARRSCHNGGDISAHYWSGPDAGPGKRANGRNKFLANFECESGFRDEGASPGPLNIYCYHPEQRDNYGDHFLPSGKISPITALKPGRETFGEHFVSRPDLVPELDRWYCYEYMVKANTPGKRDGRIACWLDGKLVADFANMRLRDVETIKIDRFGVGLYIAKNNVRANRKWYDDVVAATSYIGPMVKEKKATSLLDPAKPVAPVAPAIDAKALAPWEAKLIERVAQGIKDGRRPAVGMKVAGAREEPAKIAGADGKSVTVEVQGSALSLPWPRLSASDRLNLARAFLRDGAIEDHLLVAVFALADSRVELSDEHFAKARAADPDRGAARVAETRASLGLR